MVSYKLNQVRNPCFSIKSILLDTYWCEDSKDILSSCKKDRFDDCKFSEVESVTGRLVEKICSISKKMALLVH